jgi:hypothetical protein
VQSKADTDAVGAALRAVYLPWLEEAAKRLQDAVKKVGGMPALQAASDAAADSGTCTVFVDGLRYDVAQRLRAKLDGLGTQTLAARWTSMPSVTASGKAWCSPVAALVSGTAEDVEFEPRVAADGKPLSGHNFRKLLTDNGVQPLDKHETGDPSGRAWTESGDLDHYGHEHGVRLARDVDAQLAAGGRTGAGTARCGVAPGAHRHRPRLAAGARWLAEDGTAQAPGRDPLGALRGVQGHGTRHPADLRLGLV